MVPVAALVTVRSPIAFPRTPRILLSYRRAVVAGVSMPSNVPLIVTRAPASCAVAMPVPTIIGTILASTGTLDRRPLNVLPPWENPGIPNHPRAQPNTMATKYRAKRMHTSGSRLSLSRSDRCLGRLGRDVQSRSGLPTQLQSELNLTGRSGRAGDYAGR